MGRRVRRRVHAVDEVDRALVGERVVRAAARAHRAADHLLRVAAALVDAVARGVADRGDEVDRVGRGEVREQLREVAAPEGAAPGSFRPKVVREVDRRGPDDEERDGGELHVQEGSEGAGGERGHSVPSDSIHSQFDSSPTESCGIILLARTPARDGAPVCGVSAWRCQGRSPALAFGPFPTAAPSTCTSARSGKATKPRVRGERERGAFDHGPPGRRERAARLVFSRRYMYVLSTPRRDMGRDGSFSAGDALHALHLVRPFGLNSRFEIIGIDGAQQRRAP